jgi:hypothetical protein
MLSHLNTLIGFAALFAILSLLVTSLTQVVRMVCRTRTRALIDRLKRLFGELKDPDRFVAAILSHPTLEGRRGALLYQTLIDPTADPEKTKAAAAIVLGNFKRLWPVPWAKTVDLDKQAVKDIGQTVYEYIGHLVDHEIPSNADQEVQPKKGLQGDSAQNLRVDWAHTLKTALDNADKYHLEAMTASQGPSVRRVSPGATPVIPFRGRMWMLATSAFPESEGKTPPLKTYVAAFHDEAAASASDRQTWWIRIATVVISLLLALFLQLDALQVWKNLAQADPAKIEELVKASQSIEASLKARTDNTAPTAAIFEASPETVKKMKKAVDELQFSPFDLQPNWPWKLGWLNGLSPFLGLLLAVAALSLGAPFWFEALKSAINLKSAFSKDK